MNMEEYNDDDCLTTRQLADKLNKPFKLLKAILMGQQWVQLIGTGWSEGAKIRGKGYTKILPAYNGTKFSWTPLGQEKVRRLYFAVRKK